MGKRARRQARKMASKGKSAAQIQRRTGVSQQKANQFTRRAARSAPSAPSPSSPLSIYTSYGSQGGSRGTMPSANQQQTESSKGGGRDDKARQKLRDSRKQVQDLSGQVTSMQEELDYLSSGGLEQTQETFEDPFAIDFESFFNEMALAQEQQAMAFAEQMDAVYAGIEEQLAAIQEDPVKEATEPEGTRGGFNTTDTDEVEAIPDVDVAEDTTDVGVEDTTGLAIGGSGTETEEEETSPLSIGV